eukprot:CAMPEP_0185258058 /NCGR_PEP_ID=MMETSP1359-20130426/7043_1 /TAXON_ID=552665 /ORGANISM="Bigelowiella longifila, Strain CCMP242" /LENGTH=315 /DNA_ID=CAMNT_0027843405 /DNA_START=93 /DNA_END=1040 /DNA_ORIENTATION=+
MTSESRTFCVVGGTCNGGLETGDILNVFTRQRILRFLFGQLSAHAAGNSNNTHSISGLENNENQPALRSSSSTVDSDTKARGSASGGGAGAAIAVNNNNKNLFDEILMFTVEQLGIVSRDGVKTVTKGRACLKEVLTGLVKQNLGRVVVLDTEGRAIEMYSRSDIRIMSDEIVRVLDLDVVEAARKHPRLCTFCSRTDTLQTVMAKMAKGAATAGEVLVCVGPEPHKRYEGLVSFTSLFGILDTKQGGGGNIATVQAQASASSNNQGRGAKTNTSPSIDQKKQSAVDMEASMGDGKDTNEHANDDSNNQMQEDSS